MRRVATALITSVAAVGALVFGLTRGGDVTGDDWYRRIQACTVTAPDTQTLMRQEVQDCLLDLMLDSADAGVEPLMAMQSALSRHIDERPDLYNACHTVGHQAGQRAFEVSGDIVELITTNNVITCQYAIGHGVLDGFALSNPDDETFEAAAAACGKLKDDYPEVHTLYGLCSDGLGHAAWTSTHDTSAAVERCEMVPYEDGQEYCIEGVIMQIFEPANSEPSERLEDAEKVMTGICADWPGSAATRIGCWRGSSYPFSRPAWRFHYNRSLSPDDPLSVEDRATMQELLDRAVDACNAFTDDGPSHCLKALAQQIPPSVYTDETLTEVICGRFEEHADLCREFRYKII